MNPRVISFHYTLTNNKGDELDSSRSGDAFAFLEGVGQIIPGLEKVLAGLKVGDKQKVEVAAEEAYGMRDDNLVMQVEKSQLPKEDLQIGDQFQAGDDQHMQIVTVTEITASHVTLDANHPLAGEDLIFDVEITEVRPATMEELSHGHAHGAGGHHHH